MIRGNRDEILQKFRPLIVDWAREIYQGDRPINWTSSSNVGVLDAIVLIAVNSLNEYLNRYESEYWIQNSNEPTSGKTNKTYLLPIIFNSYSSQLGTFKRLSVRQKNTLKQHIIKLEKTWVNDAKKNKAS